MMSNGSFSRPNSRRKPFELRQHARDRIHVVNDADPTITVTRRTPQRGRRGAAHVYRNALFGYRRHDQRVEIEVLAVEFLHPALHQQTDDLDGLVLAGTAGLHVHTEPLELLRHPCKPHTQGHAVVGDRGDRAQALGFQQRLTDGQPEHGGEKADAPGHDGHCRYRDPGIQHRHIEGPEARAVRRVRIGNRNRLGKERGVRHLDAVPAAVIGRARYIEVLVGVDHEQVKSESHDMSSSSPMQASGQTQRRGAR
jgi:hypothetical protein